MSKEIKEKVLFINHTAILGGGASDDYVRLMQYLKYENYDVTAMTPEGPRVEEYTQASNHIFLYYPGILPVTHEKFIYYYYFLRSIPKQLKQFNKILNENKFDIVIFNVVVLLIPALIVKRKKLKSILIIREHVKPLWLRFILYKILNKVTKNVITVSKELSTDYTRITENENVLTLYSYIEDKLPSQNEAEFQNFINKYKTDFLFDDKIKVFVCIANITVRKNQEVILGAVQELKKLGVLDEYRFLFVGAINDDPDYFNKLKNIMEESGIFNYCFFVGNQTRSLIYDILKYSYAFILTSKSEGFPLAIIESMKFGVPVISTRVGGVHDIIENNVNGILIENTVESSLQAILSLSDKDFRSEVSRNCLTSYLKNFDKKTNLETFLNFFKKSL